MLHPAARTRTSSLPRTVLITGLAALVLPALPLLGWALARSWRYPRLLPEGASARGVRLLGDPASQIPHGLALSTVIAASVAVLACAVGFPAGRALGLHRFRGRRAVRFALLAPVLVPGLAVVMGLQVFFLRLGLTGTVPGVVLVQLMPTVPYSATVLGAAFANYDVDYERQSRALGARPWQVLVHVTLPLLRPALVAAGVFAFLISWSDYLLTVLIGAGQVQTLPVLLFATIGGTDPTQAAALALLVTIPPLLLLVAARRFLSGGVGSIGGMRW